MEKVNHPEHYSGKVECIDAMVDIWGKDAVKAFCELNAFKYLWRAERKNGIEDIEKAIWYLTKRVELEKQEIDSICGNCAKWARRGVMDDGAEYGLCSEYAVECTAGGVCCGRWEGRKENFLEKARKHLADHMDEYEAELASRFQEDS